ncbi:hypothetical protein LCGC14_0382350 [marine sediment metagenome]|uniref:Uncharacterized protein n=1 Tax=marine sediment metagenome TaxID=412755 RepID=A0A0F9VP22_9ZZZZ
MSDEARRLLEEAVEWRDKLAAHPESQEAWEALVGEDGCLDNEARAFLAQPEPAAREAAKPEHDRKELRCSRCWYRFCGSCSHNCPHCHPADTSLAAAALLAQGKALMEVQSAYENYECRRYTDTFAIKVIGEILARAALPPGEPA